MDSRVVAVSPVGVGNQRPPGRRRHVAELTHLVGGDCQQKVALNRSGRLRDRERRCTIGCGGGNGADCWSPEGRGRWWRRWRWRRGRWRRARGAMARRAARVGERSAPGSKELPVVAAGMEAELQDAVARVVPGLAVRVDRREGVVEVAAAANDELSHSLSVVENSGGRLWRIALVDVLVAVNTTSTPLS